MALRDWQVALGRLVEARSSGRELQSVLDALAGLELEDAERAWLREVTETPGFALTSYVPGWWRETRVRRAARLTFAALGAEAESRLRDYVRQVPCFTLFFVAEGLSFLEYVETLPVPAPVRAVARFERAVWALKQGAHRLGPRVDAVSPEEPLVRHPSAALVPFEAPPEVLLGALVAGAPRPSPTGDAHAALVAPGLPSLWRPATPEEARVFLACESARTAQELRCLAGVPADAVAGLLSARALLGAREVGA
jgi:hypothetical protein